MINGHGFIIPYEGPAFARVLTHVATKEERSAIVRALTCPLCKSVPLDVYEKYNSAICHGCAAIFPVEHP